MKLKKELGLLDVFCISAGAMISSGLFVLPALAYVKTGPAIIISYAIASILIIPTILSKSELITALPRTGGIFVFVDRSMGPLIGTLAGLASWFSLAFKTAFALLGMGIFITLLFPNISLIHIKLIATTFCIIFTLINMLGVKHSGRFQTLMVIALLGTLILYIVVGGFNIEVYHYLPFAPMGLNSIFASAGFVFISFAGTTKVMSVAGEVRDPKKNLPLGIMMAWAIVSLIYILAIAVMLGVSPHEKLLVTLTPFSMTGEIIMGKTGMLILSISALLAFVTTGNAGILASSRNPLAMAKDGLLPSCFTKLSNRGIPWVSVLFTSIFMIIIMLFLNLELFIKTASTLILILFTLSNLSVIFLRHKSNKKHYRPTFISPFFPWIQILAICAYMFLIYEMGRIPLLITGSFFLIGIGWYYLFAHKNVKSEYDIIHKIKKAGDIRYNDYIFFEETREVLLVKDRSIQDKFEHTIKKGLLIDYDKQVSSIDIFEDVATQIAPRIMESRDYLLSLLLKKEKRSQIITIRGFTVIFIHFKKAHKSELAFIRTKGVSVTDKFPCVHSTVFLFASEYRDRFYLHYLKWLFKTLNNSRFEKKWLAAKDIEMSRNMLLSSWKRIKSSI